jgi:hypothetical protein
MTSCSDSAFISPSYISVSISPHLTSIPVGANQVFTATVSNNLSLPQWSFLNSANGPNLGSWVAVPGSTTAITYTAPPTPPIYTQAPTAVTQGVVTLTATTTDPAGTSIPIQGDSVSFFITAPSITVGLSPATVSVALGGTEQFAGYAVGNVNNTLAWQVNGFTGGSASLGTISSAGLYTAPATMPTGGSSVTITIASQADPTKTAVANVTLH